MQIDMIMICWLNSKGSINYMFGVWGLYIDPKSSYFVDCGGTGNLPLNQDQLFSLSYMIMDDYLIIIPIVFQFCSFSTEWQEPVQGMQAMALD